MLNTKNALLMGLHDIDHAQRTVYIDSDGGGVVAQYVAKYAQWEQAGYKVIIRGGCDSACTVALGFKNVCLMPKAVLGFHPGYDPIFFGLFGYVLDPYATALMTTHYPPDAMAVISKHIDMNKDPGPARDGWRLYPKLSFIKATEFPECYQCKL